MKLPSQLICAVLLSLAFAATSRAEFAVAGGAAILDSSVTAAYDSNIRAAADNTVDYYVTFHPELRYRRLGGRFNTEISTGVIFKRYRDSTEFDSNDADIRFNWRALRINGETTGATLDLGYVETSDAVVEVNDQVKARKFSATTSGEVLMAGRNLLSAGVSYHNNQYDLGSDQKNTGGRLGYSYVGMPDGTIISGSYVRQQNKTTDNAGGFTSLDQTADTVSLSVSHPFYTDLVAAVSCGYRWLDRGALERALALPNRSGPVFDLTLKGPFLPRKYFPKTTGTFRLAYEQSDVPGLNDPSRNRLVGQFNIDWAARERTTVGVYASRSQDLTIRDLTVVNSSTGIKVTQGIGTFLSADLDLRYVNADFVNLVRTDNRYEARMSAAYQVNRAWSAQLAYRYTDSHSNAAYADFSRHIVMLTIHYVL